MELFNSPYMISIPMRAYESVNTCTPSNLISDILKNAIFIFVCNVAVKHNFFSAIGFNQNHIALSNINEVNYRRQNFLIKRSKFKLR